MIVMNCQEKNGLEEAGIAARESALTASGKGSVPALQPQNLRAVNCWIAGGGLFAIATARALGAFQKFAAQIPINAPIIVDSGGGLYDLSTEQYIRSLAKIK